MKTHFFNVPLSVFMLCGFSLSAQVTFVKGYLINEKGDSLKGELKINPKKEHELYNKVFLKEESGVQKNYKPNKVKGYGFEGKHFVSMELDGEPKFYQRLTSGYIILYKVAFEVAGGTETTYDYDYFLFREGDKKLTDVKQNKFKKQLQEWMSGAAGFANDFEDDSKKFNEASAVEVINKYNDWKKTN